MSSIKEKKKKKQAIGCYDEVIEMSSVDDGDSGS